MDLEYIHPFSLVCHSKARQLPPPGELIGLTPDSVWDWFLYSLGWHEPALPIRIRRALRKRFESIPFKLRRLLVRADLLPHRYFLPDSFRVHEPSIEAVYRLAGAIRQLAVRNIHHYSRNPLLNRVERYTEEHRLWLPEAEIEWLRMREGMCEEAEGKLIDFPIVLNFSVRKPQCDTRPIEDFQTPRGRQTRPMTLDDRTGPDGWPIKFFTGTRMDFESLGHCIAFSHDQDTLGIQLPPQLGKIGNAWIENGAWGPKNRVLFQKECSDEEVGLLLWPSLPDRPVPTPRIPIYNGDIVELVHGDQLLVFWGSKRGLNDPIIQISITAVWASKQDRGKTYADKKYVYPNPCERYPHCVKRPIHKPDNTLDPIILENQIFPKSEYSADQNLMQETHKPNKRPRLSSAIDSNEKPCPSDQSFNSSSITPDPTPPEVFESPLQHNKENSDPWDMEITVEVSDSPSQDFRVTPSPAPASEHNSTNNRIPSNEVPDWISFSSQESISRTVCPVATSSKRKRGETASHHSTCSSTNSKRFCHGSAKSEILLRLHSSHSFPTSDHNSDRSIPDSIRFSETV